MDGVKEQTERSTLNEVCVYCNKHNDMVWSSVTGQNETGLGSLSGRSFG